VHAADTLNQIALERHRERTSRLQLEADLVPAPATRLRLAAALRRAADHLDAGRPEPASIVPLVGRGL
jgi:hypothetical protein